MARLQLSVFLKIAVKSLVRRPAFVVFSVILLSLGLGLTLSVLSFSRVVLNPGFANADRLVSIHAMRLGQEIPMSPKEFLNMRASAHSLEHIVAYAQFEAADFLSVGSSVFSVKSASVTPEFLSVLGGQPLSGRAFQEADMAGGSVILSWAFWQRALLGDISKIGTNVRINGFPYTVIGVMGPQFRFPAGIDIWLPQNLNNPYMRNDHRLHTIGLLRQGKDSRQLVAELDAQRETIAPGAEMRFAPEQLLAGIIRPLKTLLYAAAIFAASILLIVAANVASLVLMRTMRDATLLAVHSALGAGRGGLLLYLFFQALFIVGASCVVGAVLYVSSFRVLIAWASTYITVSPGTFQPGVVSTLLALAICFVLLLTAVPATVALRPGLLTLLPRGHSSGGPRFRLIFGVLLTLEVAATASLLYVAGITAQSLWHLQSTPLGFRPQGVKELVIYIPNPGMQPREEIARTIENAIGDLAMRPGIERAGASLRPVLSPFLGQVEVGSSAAVSRRVDVRAVTQGYFGAIGVPVLRGRDFGPGMNTIAVVVDQETAKALWGSQDSIGSPVFFGGKTGPALQGVVGTVKAYDKPQPIAYLPFQSSLTERPPFVILHVFIRTELAASSLKSIMDDWIHMLPQGSARGDIAILDSELSPYLATPRKQQLISMVLAGTAMFVTAAGLYTVMTFWTTLARRALAIRVALGASRGTIYSHLAKPLIIFAGAGAVAGVLIARRIAYLFVSDAPNTALISWVDFATFALIAVVIILPSLRPTWRVFQNTTDVLKTG